MAENSKIEWTDHTFNPWIGCAKVSAGCTNCYAETLMDTRYGRVEWGVNGTRVRTSDANWRKPLHWNRQAEKEGRRYRVFCSSLADVFEDRPELDDWRVDLIGLIARTPHLDWLLLTKRPENVQRMITRATGQAAFDWLPANPHVWIGTSVEDQAAADERIPRLLGIPAAVRFLSMEPLLGPVDLADRWLRGVWLSCDGETDNSDTDECNGCPGYSTEGGDWCGAKYGGTKIDWVIVGGESGPKARPMHPGWARSIRDQCITAGVPFLFKQWGEYVWRETRGDSTGRAKHYFDDGVWVERVGKHEAGRELDGRTWDEFPKAAGAGEVSDGGEVG